jgi:hypothetical protein
MLITVIPVHGFKPRPPQNGGVDVTTIILQGVVCAAYMAGSAAFFGMYKLGENTIKQCFKNINRPHNSVK